MTTSCGCTIVFQKSTILFCPLHAAAQELLDTLKKYHSKRCGMKVCDHCAHISRAEALDAKRYQKC